MALSCFAWNKDGSKLAVCPNSNEIWVYKTNKTQDTSKWEIIQVLKEVRIGLSLM
jgi:actin related protein 2/3 complex subunit 1A/1B